MSTNYYAIIKAGDRLINSSTMSLHIGKTTSGVSIAGDFFPSWRAWKEFLTNNKDNDRVEIVDEYGATLTIEELSEKFESYAKMDRSRQHDFIAREHPDMSGNYSLDEDGFTVTNGGFF